MVKKTTKKYFDSKTGKAFTKSKTVNPDRCLNAMNSIGQSYTIMDIEQDFENDSENLDEVDAEFDHKNFTGKLDYCLIND